MNTSNDESARNTAVATFRTPDLGRSVRIVGHVENLDPQDSPHPKNQRGELGRALFNWRHNYVSHDPLSRVSFNLHAADPRHLIGPVVRNGGSGEVSANRTRVDDPQAMTDHIVRAGKHLGLDVVGIGQTHPSYLYAGTYYSFGTHSTTAGDQATEGPETLARTLPFMIAGSLAWDYDMVKAHRHHIGDAAYEFSQTRTRMIMRALEGYIRELGYQTMRGVVIPQAGLIACGLGELGRNGLVINDKFGARIHAEVLLTDLPLVPNKPLDIGVDAFCKICRKCATTCPTNSISFGDKVVHNGVEKYKINWETCYRLRPIMTEYASTCQTCVTVCPYTKPSTWWHALAVNTLRYCPLPLRSLWARALKKVDDWGWGTIPNKRVRWLGYDSAVKPGEKLCTVAGCTADHGQMAASIIPIGDVGIYPPLKENINRFSSGERKK